MCTGLNHIGEPIGIESGSHAVNLSHNNPRLRRDAKLSRRPAQSHMKVEHRNAGTLGVEEALQSRFGGQRPGEQFLHRHHLVHTLI